MAKKIKEFRTLPSDTKPLLERREELIDEMGSILFNADKEKRALNEEEKQKFNSIKFEIKGIDEELRILEENSGIQRENSETRAIDGIVYPDEKIEKRTYSENKNLDLGKLIKGMSGLGWNGANQER